MGKEIIIDELVRDAFIFENQTPAVGLLVGACTETGDICVAHLAQTLEEANPRPDADGNPSDSVSPDLRTKSFTEIHLPTISHHVKQVIRMLPGGLVVLGLFVVEPVDNIFTTKYEGILKSILTIMNKSLARTPYYGADFGKNSEKLVIHFNPTTKKFTVKQIDGQTFKMQQMETVFSRLEWAKVESEYDTFYAMHLGNADIGLPLKKNMKLLMDTFHQTLNEAIFIVNGRKSSMDEEYVEQVPRSLDSGMSDGEDVGDHSESTGGGSGSSSPKHGSDSGNESETENTQNRPLSALYILVEKTPGSVRETKPGQDFVTHLHLLGKIAVAAFVRKGSSTASLVDMVKQDILRSLAARIEMHCESLIEEEQGVQSQIDEGTNKVYHEVPRRVFANLLGSKLLVSDYLFPGEGPTDSVVSFRDILSLRLDDESDIIMTREKPFNLDELRSKGSLEELLCNADPLVSIATQRSSSMGVVFGVTLIIVILGVVISILLKTDYA